MSDSKKKRQIRSIVLNLSSYVYEQQLEMTLFDCGFYGIGETGLCSECREKTEQYMHVLRIFRERLGWFLDESMEPEIEALRDLLDAQAD
jgi:hypothetical protein